jgi:hypothetical protein
VPLGSSSELQTEWNIRKGYERLCRKLREVSCWTFVSELCNLPLIHYVLQGVTYCGTSKASNLTMENVPWHGEVVSFVRKLGNLLPDYDIASEHEHSNCVLLAHQKVSHSSEPCLYLES